MKMFVNGKGYQVVGNVFAVKTNLPFPVRVDVKGNKLAVAVGSKS